MTSEIENALIATVASVGVNSAIIFLLKSWISVRLKSAIQHEYNCLLEVAKNDLKANLEKSLAIHKHQLDIKSKGFEIQEKWIQEKFANAMVETNDALWDFLIAVNKFVTLFQGPEYKDPNRINEVIGAHREFVNRFRKNKLFLPDDLIDEIEKFISLLRDKAFDYQKSVVLSTDRIKEIDNWNDIDSYVVAEGQKIFKSLQSKFKIHLGVDKKSLNFSAQQVNSPEPSAR